MVMVSEPTAPDVDVELAFVRRRLSVMAQARLLVPFTRAEQAAYDALCRREVELLAARAKPPSAISPATRDRAAPATP